MRPDAFGLLAVTLGRGFSEQQRDRMVEAIAAGVTDSIGVGNRMFCLDAIAHLLGTRDGVSQHALDVMHRATLAAVADPRFQIRRQAVETLGRFRDPKDRGLLVRISENDTSKVPSNGTIIFPVRDEAAKAVRKIP